MNDEQGRQYVIGGKFGDAYTVGTDSTVVHTMQASTPATIAITPNASSTVAVKIQIVPGGNWRTPPDGRFSAAVSSATVDVLTGPVHALQFSATSASAMVEIAQ